MGSNILICPSYQANKIFSFLEHVQSECIIEIWTINHNNLQEIPNICSMVANIWILLYQQITGHYSGLTDVNIPDHLFPPTRSVILQCVGVINNMIIDQDVVMSIKLIIAALLLFVMYYFNLLLFIIYMAAKYQNFIHCNA